MAATEHGNPPILLYLACRQNRAKTIRANIIAYLAVTHRAAVGAGTHGDGRIACCCQIDTAHTELPSRGTGRSRLFGSRMKSFTDARQSPSCSSSHLRLAALRRPNIGGQR